MIIPDKQKKTKGFNKLNLKAAFDNETVSSNVSFTYIEAFKATVALYDLIESTISYRKAPNSTYQTTQILDYMFDCIIQGYTKFQHMDGLRTDNAYKSIKGNSLPSEKVCRDLIKDMAAEETTVNGKSVMGQKALEELRLLNRKLLACMAATTGARDVTLNFDDTVCTVFGEQEGAEAGYNPRYKGRPSFKEKLGIIADTDEVIDITLESGKHHTNHEFLTFFKNCLDTMPESWYVKRIRGDKGLFDQKNFKFCEDNFIEYVIKAKMQQGVKDMVAFVNQHPDKYPWVQIDKVFSVTEAQFMLQTWDTYRRFVIIRKKLPESKDGQMRIDADEFKYEYQAIVTNIGYLSAVEIFHEYNQRCDIENKIDELKEGFAFDENSQKDKICNEIFLLIKMIAYNIHNWFKQSVLPDELQHHEIQTLRRLIYKVPGNIVGNGWYRHIRFAPNQWLEWVINHIREALEMLRLKVFPAAA